MFKTPQGQARYFAAYDATLSLWPVPVESVDLPTRFGFTHLQTRLIPGAGHAMNFDQPELVNQSILEFLAME